MADSLRQRKRKDNLASSLESDASSREELPLPKPFRRQHENYMSRLGVVLLVMATAAVLSPLSFGKSCFAVEKCTTAHDKNREQVTHIHAHLATFVGTLCLREVATLVGAYLQERDTRLKPLGMPRFSGSALLMCVCLSGLFGLQLSVANNFAWVHAVPPIAGFRETWGFVHTLQYIFWQLEVPILLLLCGHFVLCRPLSEVLPPAIATSVYMHLSWWALVVNTFWLRAIFVTCCFMIYLWATWRVLLWVRSFLQTAPRFFPGRWTRITFLVWLNILFAFYGVIYLLEMFELIRPQRAFDIYAICDSSAKAVTCFCLAHLRSAEQSDALSMFVAVSRRLNRANMSILRTSFDHLIPCRLDENGDCCIQDANNADVAALEKLIGRPLGNAYFSEVLYSQRDKQLFKKHMTSALQQERDDLHREALASEGVESKWFEEDKLFQQGAAVATVLNYDCRVTVRGSLDGATQSVPISMHISAAMGNCGKDDSGPQMILALRVQYEDSPQENNLTYGSSIACSNLPDALGSSRQPSGDSGSESILFASSLIDKQSAVPTSKASLMFTLSSNSESSTFRSRPPKEPRRAVPSVVNTLDSVSSCSLFETIEMGTQTINLEARDVATETLIRGDARCDRCAFCAKPPTIPDACSRADTNSIRSPSPRSSVSEYSPRSSGSDRSSTIATTPSHQFESFSGTWLITNEPLGMAPFLKALTITGKVVVDADKTRRSLKWNHRTGVVAYEGGTMFIEDGMLIRVGKKGARYCYVRNQHAQHLPKAKMTRGKLE